MNNVPVYWIEIIGALLINYYAEQVKRPITRKWIAHDAVKGDSTAGTKNCWVSLLKPVIRPDGGVCPCLDRCDVSMGDDLLKIYAAQKPFDGSKCERCYNSGYNEILEAFVNKPERVDWL